MLFPIWYTSKKNYYFWTMQIKVKHPLKEKNRNQEEFIKNLKDEPDKEFHSLLFSYGNATYLYHNLPYEATEQDYNEWLEGLNEPIKSDMKDKGFEACKSILSFTRYVREKNDIGLEEFVKKQMGENDYQKFTLLHS